MTRIVTEREWPTCSDPERMIQFLPRHAWGERRGRLFTVACARRLHTLPDARLTTAIDAAERFADGVADEAELDGAIRTANGVVEWEARHDMSSWQSHAAGVVAAAVAVPAEEYSAITEFCDWATTEPGAKGDTRLVIVSTLRKLADLVRELVGNPFRPVSLNPSWRTSDVLALARGIYEERAFDRMPILADALQDAGCDSDDILSHCRDEKQTHVRGCWVVDLVLGKA